MRYRFCSNIRVRICDKHVFFVDIGNNHVLKTNYDAYEFLNNAIKKNICESNESLAFLNYLETLKKQNVIEAVKDEVK